MQTKTYPLDGGYQQDVSEFAIDAPGMVQSLNSRWCKLGEVEKSEPLEPTTPPPTSALRALGKRDGRVYVLDESGEAYEYMSDDSWDGPFEGSLKPHKNTVVLDSVPTPAIHATVWLRGTDSVNYSPGRDYIVTAWEKRSINIGGSLPNVDVVVEVRWEDNGQLITKGTYSGRTNPQAVDLGSAPFVFFCNSSAQTIQSVSFDESTHVLSAPVTLGITNGPVATDNAVFTRHFAALGPSIFRDEFRLGNCIDGGRGASFSVAGDPSTNRGIISWTNTTGVLFTSRLTSTGTLTGPELSSGGGRDILGTTVRGNRAAIIFAVTSNTGSYDIGQSLFGETFDLTGSLSSEGQVTLQALDQGRYSNGTVYVSGTTVYFAATEFNGLQNLYYPASEFDLCIVRHGTFTAGGSVNGIDIIKHHRLASNNVLADGLNTFVIEQCVQTEPVTTSGGVQTAPTHYKGLTPILVGAGTTSNTNYKVLSSYDAGQSRSVNGSSQEQHLHKNVLTYDGDFYYGNRVLQQPEDLYFQQSGRDTASSKAKGVYFFGEWQFRVYQTSPNFNYKTIEYGSSSLLNTSVASWYAGDVIAELSPLEQPEITRFENANGTLPTRWGYEIPPGANADDVRTCVVVVGYTDKNGSLHRSPPSLTVFAEGNFAAVDDGPDVFREVTITNPVSALRDARDYFVEIFIGQGSQDPQLVHTESFSVDNLRDDLIFKFRDSHSSPSNTDPVRASEILYTAGNVLAADAWPEFEDFTITSNRMWGISRSNPSNVYYSKLFEENIAPEFNVSLVVPLGRNRTCTAIGSLDDKVIVFTENEVFAIYGTGPDNTGANGSFIVDKLQTRYGCTDPNSLVEYEQGLCWFSSVSSEFHALNQDLQVKDIGSAVQDFSDQIASVSTGLVYPEQNEIRWACSFSALPEFGVTRANGSGPARPKFTQPADGSMLVYDYGNERWTMLENQSGNFSVLYNGKPFYARIVNLCERVSDDWAFSELLKIETPWIRVGNLQTLGRVEEIAFLGRYLSSWTVGSAGLESGDIQVTLRYDYEEFGADTDVFRFRANNGDLGTESGDRMQFSVHPGRPKCQAVKILVEEVATTKIDDSEPTYSRGRGFALTGMDIIYGTKAGLGTRTTAERKSK